MLSVFGTVLVVALVVVCTKSKCAVLPRNAAISVACSVCRVGAALAALLVLVSDSRNRAYQGPNSADCATNSPDCVLVIF